MLALTGSVQGQYPKLIVQLTDKGGSTFSLNSPSAYLSSRAIQRRTRQNIAADSSDLPVLKKYLDSIVIAGNVQILSQSKWLNQVLIQSTDQAALNKIAAFPFVKKVRGVGYRPSGNPAEPVDKFKIERTEEIATPVLSARTMGDQLNYGNSYNQVHIHNGEFLHNKEYQGQGMHIAVLDGGFNSFKTNTAFDSIRINKQVLGERDFVAFDNSVNEDNLHGANCLSTMAANWPGKLVGTSPQASYWLIRTENSTGEYPIEEHNWAVGAEFADSSGVDMISASLGYTDFDDPAFDHSYSQFYNNSTMVSQAATFAAKKGMIVMNSAGNEGNSSWKYLVFPADADSVCSVGAVNGSGQIGSFSSYGYPGRLKPNIVSVGVNTVLAGLNNQPVTGSGTSYSTPNVAGLIACLWQAFPSFTNMQVLDVVYKSSDRYATPDNRFGFGIPNFKTAYRLLKKQINFSIYGSNWLLAAPNPFTSKITGSFVGQVDGNARVELVNAAGSILYSRSLLTEMEEVYNFSFDSLDALPRGAYTVRYADSLSARSVALEKNIPLNNDWLRLNPGNIFTGNLNVNFTAQETGTVAFRIVDSKGSKLAEQQLNITQGQSQQFNLSLSQLPKGVYYLQYLGKSQKRVIRLLKL